MPSCLSLVRTALPMVFAIGLGPAWLPAQAGPVLDRIRSTGTVVLAHRESSVPFSFVGPDGQPVGSRTLSKETGLDLSPATIRNVMADLEDLGLIASPHTSAGRVPTPRGYRLFVDTMLTVNRDQLAAQDGMATASLQADQPHKVINHAAQLLSNMSQFVGVVMAPRRASVFRHIEFLSLSERRVLVIIVSPDGEVQNRVIHTQTVYNQSQLQEAANFLNAHYAGLAMDEVRLRLKTFPEVITVTTEQGRPESGTDNETLNLANDQVWSGGFAYWRPQALMVWRYGLSLAGGQYAGAEQLNHMISSAITSCERYYPAFQLVSWGEHSPADSMKVAIAEAYGRA